MVVRACGLAAADSGKDGTSDPFAKITVRCAGKKDQSSKTKALKDTVDPVWNQSFSFKNVLDESGEIVISVWDDDVRKKAEALGEMQLVLKSVDKLPRDGTWHPVAATALGPVSEKGVKQVHAAQGTLEVLIAWVQPLDKSAKDKVAELSSKDQYEFGDLTKLIVSRASQLTMKDATMLLKALLSFNVGLSSVGGLLPIKFLVEVLNYSLLVDVGERLAGMVAVEIDKRVKEALTGDAEYKLGDLTKRAVKSFTGKEEYAFGDVSREVMRRFEEPGGAAATAFGDSDGSTAIDAELAEELDRWDARFLAARDADAAA